MADKKVVPVRSLRKMENAYKDDIRKKILEPLFDSTLARLNSTVPIRAAWTTGVESAFSDFMAGAAVTIEGVAFTNMDAVRRYHSEVMRGKLIRAFGVQIRPFSELTIRPFMNALIDENARLITNMIGETQDRLSASIASVFDKKGFDQQALKSTLVDRFDIGDRRAKFIARDQTSKTIGALNKTRQEEIGIREYEWDDSGDGAVRDDHHAMHGKTCRWDDATVYKTNGIWMPRSAINGVELHPGQDYNCRCVGIAIISEEMFNAFATSTA